MARFRSPAWLLLLAAALAALAPGGLGMADKGFSSIGPDGEPVEVSDQEIERITTLPDTPPPPEIQFMIKVTKELESGVALDKIAVPLPADFDAAKLKAPTRPIKSKAAADVETHFLNAAAKRAAADHSAEAAKVLLEVVAALSDATLTPEEFAALKTALTTTPAKKASFLEVATGLAARTRVQWSYWAAYAWYSINYFVDTSHLALWTASEPCCATRSVFGWYNGWNHRLQVRYAHVGVAQAASHLLHGLGAAPGPNNNRNTITGYINDVRANLHAALMAAANAAGPGGLPGITALGAFANNNIVNQLRLSSGGAAPAAVARHANYDTVAQHQLTLCFQYLANLPHDVNSDVHDATTAMNGANNHCMLACAMAHASNPPGFVAAAGPAEGSNIRSCSVGRLVDRQGNVHQLMAFSGTIAPAVVAPSWLAGMGAPVTFLGAANEPGNNVLTRHNVAAPAVAPAHMGNQYASWDGVADHGAGAAAWPNPPEWPLFTGGCSEDRIITAAQALR